MLSFNNIVEQTNNNWLVWSNLTFDLAKDFFMDYETFNSFNSLFMTFEFKETHYENCFICLSQFGFLVLLDEKFTSGKDGSFVEGLTLYIAKSSEDVTPLPFTQEELSQLLKIIKVQSDKNPFNQ